MQQSRFPLLGGLPAAVAPLFYPVPCIEMRRRVDRAWGGKNQGKGPSRFSLFFPAVYSCRADERSSLRLYVIELMKCELLFCIQDLKFAVSRHVRSELVVTAGNVDQVF